MNAAVHISADRKSDITFVVHADNAHCVAAVSAPCIRSFPAVEAEYFCQFRVLRIKKPEVIRLYKSGGSSILILFILHIPGSDP